MAIVSRGGRGSGRLPSLIVLMAGIAAAAIADSVTLRGQTIDTFTWSHNGDTLEVTNLQKIFWPKIKKTKGDLIRFYAKISPFILPVIDNRPLVMKRLPHGIEGPSFYQHRAPEPVPSGVRIETLPDDDVPARLIGGSLKTLLYMAQLASISMDPWFSTMDDLESADQVAIDLDPQPGATLAAIEVALALAFFVGALLYLRPLKLAARAAHRHPQ